MDSQLFGELDCVVEMIKNCKQRVSINIIPISNNLEVYIVDEHEFWEVADKLGMKVEQEAREGKWCKTQLTARNGYATYYTITG